MILGDRTKFAFDVEWSSCEPLADEGLSATWCEFQIICQGKVLTQHVDGGVRHDAIVIPAAPLAAWLGQSWTGLVTGERLWNAAKAANAHALLELLDSTDWEAHREELARWLETHSLLSVRRGLVLPNVIFWRRGSFVDISWRGDAEPRAHRGIQYLATGAARLRDTDVLPVFRDFVNLVGQRSAGAPASSTARAEVESAIVSVLLNAPTEPS